MTAELRDKAEKRLKKTFFISPGWPPNNPFICLSKNCAHSNPVDELSSHIFLTANPGLFQQIKALNMRCDNGFYERKYSTGCISSF
uniref:Uncharacterized protein n=1 Tax=Parascaris equorum TaxID=6256 RepID=A0A914SGL0_PAREQ